MNNNTDKSEDMTKGFKTKLIGSCNFARALFWHRISVSRYRLYFLWYQNKYTLIFRNLGTKKVISVQTPTTDFWMEWKESV